MQEKYLPPGGDYFGEAAAEVEVDPERSSAAALRRLGMLRLQQTQ